MRRRCTAAGGSASLPAQPPGPRSSSWLRRLRAVSSLPRAASQTAATARSYRAKALTTLHRLTKRSSRHMPETGWMTGTSCSSALHFQTIRTHDDGRRDSRVTEVVYDFDRCSVHSADNGSKKHKNRGSRQTPVLPALFLVGSPASGPITWYFRR